MNFNGIVDFVCAKVSKTDDVSQARCLDYIQARDRMIYESFDWRASQILVSKTYTAGPSESLASVGVPEVSKVLSLRINGIFLDPVSASYIFESATNAKDDYTGIDAPRFYQVFWDDQHSQWQINLYPNVEYLGDDWHVIILGKAPYDDNRNSPSIPETESALIALVIADMWEYLHQVGKAQAKFQEGNALLQTAHQMDTAGPERPRRSKIITPNGNSLAELADSVCDIIGLWTPDVVNSVKSRIHRNHQAIWESMLWPESFVTFQIAASGDTCVLPHLLDTVIGVRINLDVTNNSYQTVPYGDSSMFFGLVPEIFNQTGTPIAYNLLLPLGVSRELVAGSTLSLIFNDTETGNVDIRGELGGADKSETISVNGTAPVTTVNPYDVIYTLHKGYSLNSLRVQSSDGTSLITLQPNEQGRKYPRIQLLPAFDSSDATVDQTVFVLGKRKCPNLIIDGDVSDLTGIENYLINASAADMLTTMDGKLPIAQEFRQKAAAALQILADRKIKQNTYQPTILPYVEPDPWCCGTDVSFLG